jgi:hypothetical protein
MLNSENNLLVIYKQIKINYVMQDSNVLDPLKESTFFLIYNCWIKITTSEFKEIIGFVNEIIFMYI